MNEQNKSNSKQEEAPKSIEGATAAKPLSWKRILAKKWVYPATYMAAAAIILTIMWVYQGTGTKSLTQDSLGLEVTTGSEQLETGYPDAVPVIAATETMSWPVDNRDEVSVNMPYFDSEASNEDRQAALIEYEDTYMPSIGISLAREDNETFNVVAAMSGTVTRVEKLPLIGNLVEITHDHDLKTIYQSLTDVSVVQDAEVTQGEVIAKAGRNELERSLGVHVHFEVHQNGQPVNPESFIVSSEADEN